MAFRVVRALVAPLALAFFAFSATGCSGLLGIDYLTNNDVDGGVDAGGPSSNSSDAAGTTDAGGTTDAANVSHDAGSSDGATSADGGNPGTCPATICTQVGTVCQDGQTVATCGHDDGGTCVRVASTAPCTAPQSCSGTAPGAGCSLTCTDSCTAGQTACVAGALATCARGSNGCLAYGTPVACPGTRQSCTGAAGTATCGCNMDPVCTSIANTCASTSTLASCAQDGQGCFYESAIAMTCANGACSAGACCTNGCTNGSTQCVSSTSVQSCAPGSNLCTQWSAASTCATGNVCERYGGASCVDPNWAEWPMPNDPGDVTLGAPTAESYTDNGDGTVTDNVTGLMWQQTITATFYNVVATPTAGTGQSYCASLQLGGHTDWRLPSVIEFLSIVDPTFFPGQQMLNTTYFTTFEPPGALYLTSTAVAGMPGYAWIVFIDEGDPLISRSTNGPVRCVR